MAILLNDTFTGAEGDLNAHASNSGHSWARHEDAATSVLSISDANRVRPSSGTNALYIASLVPGTADYEVVGEIDRLSDIVAAPTIGIAGRVHPTQLTYYMLRASVLAGQTELTWTLTKFVNTVNTTLGTWVDTTAFGTGATRTFTLRMVGDQISALIDGVTRITATDASIVDAGRVGVRGPTSTVNNGVGTHLDSILAQDVEADVPSNLALPELEDDGSPQVGETLTVDEGSWANGPITSYAYQFERSANGTTGWTTVQAKSATASYVIQNPDAGQFLRVRVWATNAAGESAASADSAAIEVIAPITAADIAIEFSGGAANANPDLSIGGARGADLDATEDLSVITGAAALTGQTDYLCLYVVNEHPVTAVLAEAWLFDQIDGGDATYALGAATEAPGSNVAAVANRFTAPAGVAFSSPVTVDDAIALGQLDPGEQKGVWVRRTVLAGANPTGGTPLAGTVRVTLSPL